MKQKKKIYKQGLKTWRDTEKLLNKAVNIECPVCLSLNCDRHVIIGDFKKSTPSLEAMDCPVANDIKLCRKMHRVGDQIGKLRDEARDIVYRLEVLHGRKGLL